MHRKFLNAIALKEKITNEKKLPRATNQRGERYSFIAKIRGSIYGKSNTDTISIG